MSPMSKIMRVNILFILVYIHYFTSIFTIDSKISTFLKCLYFNI